MVSPSLEIADIFRDHGPAWRERHRGHISIGQLKAMSAIERCRSVALGGHALHCDDCDAAQVAYNSCRNRHCPKCQGSAARQWLANRQAELLPVEYYHVVFTLPARIGDIAFQNPTLIYDVLFKATAQTLRTIGADPKHLGASLGFTAVLHTWGSAMTHHPHLHCIIPGGGLSSGGDRWIPCKRGFFLPVRVLSRLFRRLFLEQLAAVHDQLKFHGKLKKLTESEAFTEHLAPLRQTEWVVYAKRPFAGPEAVLAYLSRYTHRIAISNSRLITCDDRGVTFKWKDYRNKECARQKTMTLAVDEFIRRYLQHVLPRGFHRIRHFGLFANHLRTGNLQRIRELLGVIVQTDDVVEALEDTPRHPFVCRHCGASMFIVLSIPRLPMSRGPPA
jgi:hypothetical protein